MIMSAHMSVSTYTCRVAVERQQRDRRLGPGGGPWFLAVAAGRIVFTASGRAFVALVEVCTVLGRRVVAGNRVLVCRSGWWQTRVAWREGMAARVAGVYRELLGEQRSDEEALPEARRNPALRRRDWRFALPEAELVESWKLPWPGRAAREIGRASCRERV